MRSFHACLTVPIIAALAFCGGFSTFARAGSYPEKPIRFIVGFGQGGPTDVVARVLAEEVGEAIGKRVFVENRPGASGNIATQAAITGGADGYTFLIGASPLAVNHSLFPDFPIKFGTDVVAVAPIGATANVLVVHPSLKMSAISEFKALAASQAGFVNYVTLGKGSSSHLAGVEFDRQAGTEMIPVPYRGNGEAVQDIVGGHVKAWFATIPSVVELVRGGQLSALAVTGPSRVSSLPNVPTLAESGFPGFDVRLWIGLFAPAGIPADHMAVFDAALEKAMAAPELQRALEAQGIDPIKMTRADFTGFVNSEIERWSKVVDKLR